MPKDLSKPFIQRLYDSKTPADKFSALQNEAEISGFDGVAYTFIPKLSRLTESLKPVYQYSESYSDLVDYYQKHNLNRNDFIIRLVEEGRLDILDWGKETKKATLTKEEEKVSKVAKEIFGATKGVTFPTLSNDIGFAGVSVISFDNKFRGKEVTPEILKHLKKCSKMYLDHTMIHQDARYEFILPILESLTPKKKIVLKYLISGQPMKNITTEADITTRYAEKLLVGLRKDFGDISKNELIYFLGLLNITEYF